MSEEPEVLRKIDFARHIQRAPSYVTKLKDQGRLVLTPSGMVKVRESLALIERTQGGRDDVADRWAAERAGEGVTPQPALQNAASAPDSSPVATMQALPLMADLREQRAAAELRRTLALAQQEEMTAAKMRGDLIARDDVEAAFRFTGAAVRGALDVMADQVAPLVAPLSDLDDVHAQLQEAARHVQSAIDQAVERQRAELAKGAHP